MLSKVLKSILTIVILFSVVPGTVRAHPVLQENWVWSVEWSPDGTKLAVGRRYDSVTIYSDTLEELVSWQTNFSDDLAWSPDSEYLAIGVRDEDYNLTVEIWNIPQVELTTSLPKSQADFLSLAWKPDATQLATATGHIKLWDITTGDLITLLEGDALMEYSVAWSPDGQFLASESNSNGVEIWDTSSQKLLTSFLSNDPISRVVWSPDNTQIAFGSGGNIEIWDIQTSQRVITLPGEGDIIRSLDWKSNRLASSHSLNGRGMSALYVWDTDSWQLLSTQQTSVVVSLALSPDGDLLAYGSEMDVEIIATSPDANGDPDDSTLAD